MPCCHSNLYISIWCDFKMPLEKSLEYLEVKGFQIALVSVRTLLRYQKDVSVCVCGEGGGVGF